jgi:hypothetical protein
METSEHVTTILSKKDNGDMQRNRFAIVLMGIEERGTSSQALRVCSSDATPPTTPSTHRSGATRVFVWTVKSAMGSS